MAIGLLSYVVAFVAFSLCQFAGDLAFAVAVPALRRERKLLPFARFIFDFVATLAGVYAIHWLGTVTRLRTAYAMVIIAGLPSLFFHMKRLSAAQSGSSSLRSLMEAQGEAEKYDQRLDVRSRRLAEIGFMAGYIVGFVAFFRGEPFF